MYGNRFYNATTRKYIALFGTLFNDIVITRDDNDDTEIQKIKVPIHYAPMQKILARIEGDASLDAPAMTLPRMSFEMMNMTYAPDRKLQRRMTLSQGAADDAVKSYQFAPTPYNLEFQLNIMTKYEEDGTKIVEQIIPFFKPDVTHSVQILSEFEEYFDIPIVLNGVSKEDTYESDFQTRRVLIWTLNFTLKGIYFGPTSEKKVIKFIDVNLYDTLDENSTEVEQINIQPGLTANGEPTTNIDETVDYVNINVDDNWGYIVQIKDA